MTVCRLSAEMLLEAKADVIALIRETMRYNFPSSMIEDGYYEQTVQSLAQYLEQDKAVVFAAYEDGALQGWIWCHEIDRMGSKRLHIASFAVKEGTRKKGVGQQLMQQAQDYARDNGYAALDLLVTASNATAVGFYEKQGFQTERLLLRKDLT